MRRRGPGPHASSASTASTAIIHFAGSIVVPESVADPLGYYLNNTVKSRALMEAAVAAGVRAFHLLLDRRRLRQPEVIPVAEDAAARADVALRLVQADDRDHAGRCGRAPTTFRYVALRYFNVAGADPQGRSGQSTPRATHLIKVACETALGKRSHMDVFGTDYRRPTAPACATTSTSRDLARAHVAALDAPARGRRVGHLQLRLLARATRCSR